MQEIKTALESKALDFNAAALADDYAKQAKINKDMEPLITAYAKKSKESYLDSKATLADAIKAPTYRVLKIKDTTDSESGLTTRSIDFADKTIQLNDLCVKFPESFRFKNWKAYIEQLNLRLCLLTATKLELPKGEISEIEEKFRMVNGGKAIDLEGTPTSNTQLLKQLRTVINGIMGEEDITSKVTSHDVEYLKMVYTSKGRALRSVKTMNSAKLADAILNIMNRVMTGTTYSVEYQKAKDSTASGTVEDKSKEVANATSKETAKESKPISGKVKAKAKAKETAKETKAESVA